jgi:hypothetical protein
MAYVKRYFLENGRENGFKLLLAPAWIFAYDPKVELEEKSGFEEQEHL